MRKYRLFNHMIITALTLSFIIGSASSYVSAESVSENNTSVISVSENAYDVINTQSLTLIPEDVPAHSHDKDLNAATRDNLIKEGYHTWSSSL